jgi:hypothetical protein
MGLEPSVPADSQSASLLLAEFSERSQDWRHADSMVERSLGLYITVCTILVPSALAFWKWQFATGPVLVQAVGAIVAFALGVAGMFTARAILGADLYKAEFSRAQRLIRRYFVDKDSEVAAYLLRPVEESPAGLSRDQSGHPLNARVHRVLMWVLHIWNSGLLILGVALFLRCTLRVPVRLVIEIGPLAWIATCVFLVLRFRYWEKKFTRIITSE